MRRPSVYRALSTALSVAPTPPVPLYLEKSLSLIRILAVACIIGSQFCCVSGTTSIEPTSTAANTQSNSTEQNNFYFDAFNATRKISSTAVDVAATSLYVSQTPAETMPPTDISPFGNTLSTGSYLSKTSMRMHAGVESTSMSIKNSRVSIGNDNDESDDSSSSSSSSTSPAAATERVPVGYPTAAVTLKSARSTIKEPIDSARSRNHWVVGAFDAERPRTFRNKHHHEHHWGPFFEEPLNSANNLLSTAHLFTEAVLNCRVGMLKDKTVMWVRRTTEKVSLLTVGNVTYSGDPRIRVKFQYPNNWRLLINPTRKEDAGIYMCQVSTHPPRVFTTNLTILEPPLRIIDEHERDVGDRYYKAGSTVDLQCQVSRNFFQKERYNILKSTETQNSLKYSTTLNALNDTTSDLYLIANTNQTHVKLTSQALEKYFTNFMSWAKDDEPLQAVANKRSSVTDKWLISRVAIPEARLADSGNYSCSLGRLFTVIVQVQVLTGELPAAVQHNLAQWSTTSWPPLPWILLALMYIFFGNYWNQIA